MSKIQFPGKASDFLKIGVAATARGDVEAVRAILDERPGWLSRVGARGRTMLWEASHRGKLGVVEYLVECGADINSCGTHHTPYFVEVSCYCIARHKRHHDVAEFLMERGVIRVLMKAGADPLHVNRRGETAREVADWVGVELPVVRK